MNKPNAKSGSSASSEITAGIFVLIGLVLFGLLILKFGDFKHWNRSKYQLMVRFDDAASLIKNAPVRRGGVEIGRILNDPYLEKGMTGVNVPLSIYSEFHIAQESEFHIKGDGLMGDSFVDVIPPKIASGKMLNDGDKVIGTSHGDLSSSANMVADNAKLVMGDIQLTLKDIRDAISKFTSEENRNHLTGSLGKMETSLAKIDSEVLSAKNTTSLATTLEDLQKTANRLTLAAENAEKLLATADKTITEKMAPGMEEFTKAMSSFRKTADSLGLVSTDMRTSTGLIPALIKDAKLREDFAALASNLRRNGMLFYKDDYDKIKAEAQKPKQEPERKGFFR